MAAAYEPQLTLLQIGFRVIVTAYRAVSGYLG
jgi:hypothetical protein